MQFSIKTLLLLTTVVAIGTVAYMALGTSAIWLLLWGYVIAAGAISHNDQKPTPFWSGVASLLILVFLFSGSVDVSAGTNAVVVFALVFTLGGYLASLAIRRGHWTTKILGSILLAFYATIFLFILGTVM